MAMLLAIAASTSPAASTSADAATSAHARNLAATCAACHMRAGAGIAAIPPLDGRVASDTVHKMRAFKSGTRAGTVMPQLARGYTDADIDAIARWYAARRP